MLETRTPVPHILATVAAAVVMAGAAASPHLAEPPLAARPLPFFYDLYTFRGTADSTLVLAAYAVPAASLEREQLRGETRYRFDVTLVLADTATGRVYRTDDSVHVRVPRRHARRHLLSTHIQVHAPPSVTMLQYVVMIDATTPGIGQLYTASAPVPDYSGTRLMLSDIALGHPGSVQGWRHRGVTLALLPTAEFPRSAFDVYYEIYNLPHRNRYTTEIAVERIADARGRVVADDSPVRVRYLGRSEALRDGTFPELRHVDAAVSNGRYRITVTITDEESGATASRARIFQVSDRATEAMFVAALPRGLRQPRPPRR